MDSFCWVLSQWHSSLSEKHGERYLSVHISYREQCVFSGELHEVHHEPLTLPFLLAAEEHRQFLQSVLDDNMVLKNTHPDFQFYPGVRQFWIRSLYQKLVGTLELDMPDNPDHRRNMAITGTPGVGKSIFAVYLLYVIVNNLIDVDSNIRNVVLLQITGERTLNRMFVFQRCGTGQWAPSQSLAGFEPHLFINDATVGVSITLATMVPPY